MVAKKPTNNKPDQNPAEKSIQKPDEKRKSPSRKKNNTSIKTEEIDRFPVIGLGASAGGLNALRSFFAELPVKSGMSFVVMIHMSPKQPSMLQELLQKVTEVPVSTAQDGQTAEPDHIYVIPPNKEITMFRGRLQLLEVIGKHSLLPIDHFLKSIALDQGSRSAAVILSGTGTDGTLGAKEIKANEGLVLVQSEASAEYDGMPRSVINSGAADAVLSPQEMPQKLLHYFRRRDLDMEQAPTAAEDRANWLPKIFAILRAKVGHDFSQYKVNTLLRRISRRMGINQVEEHSSTSVFCVRIPMRWRLSSGSY